MANQFYLWQRFLSRLGLWIKKFRQFKFWIKVFLADFVLKSKKIRIIEAKTDKEKRMVYRLRYEVYNRCGYINPEDFPDGELKDEDDEHSISYLALKNNKPVGTVNLVLGNKPTDFATFRVFNVNFNKFLAPLSKTGEVSRLAIINSEDDYEIWLCMMKKVYQKSQKLDLQYWVFCTYEKLIRKIKKKFNARVIFLPLLQETTSHLKEREKYKGFFSKFNMVPCFIDLKQIVNS